MRIVLVAGLALTLSACGGGETETTEMNNMATDDSMMMDQNATMGSTMGTGPSAQNMMMNDQNMMMHGENMMMNHMDGSAAETNRAGM